jgi:undecaprenyl-diphosphatase
MLALTLTGSTWMIIVLTCVLFASRKRLPALYVLITGLITVLATECIKVIVARPRPFELLTDVTSRERFVVGMGFPSGHTAVTTAVAIVLSAHIPKRWRALLVLWVVAVGLSRMYLGVHAPLDVIGGIAVGIIVGFGLQEIWPRLSRALK